MSSHLKNQVKVNRAGPGRPRTGPNRVRGDKAYSSRAIRTHLRDRGHVAGIHHPAIIPVTVNGLDPLAANLQPWPKRTTRPERRRTELQ
jgi:hypothetical protein